MEQPVLLVLVQRVPQALAVLVQQAPQAYKALPVLALPAQRGCKAPLVLTERQALPALA